MKLDAMKWDGKGKGNGGCIMYTHGYKIYEVSHESTIFVHVWYMCIKVF